MIDWVNAVLPFKHDRLLCGGHVLFVDQDGQTERTTMKKALARGSYDSRVAIQTSIDHAPGTHIWVSGSPKVVQGHNLFGTDDPLLLAAHLARQALSTFGISVDPFTFRSWLSGRDVKFTRIDVTEMLDLGTETDASSWLIAVADHSRMKHRGRGREEQGTVYFGKRSRRWSLKLYQKFVELQSRSKSHRLPAAMPEDIREQLTEYARGTVRAEVVLQSMHLKQLGLQAGEAWKSIKSRDVWSRHMATLELPSNIPVRGHLIEKIPTHLRSTYALWQEACDLRSLMKRPTFYRHRAALKEFGVDIALPPRERSAQVIPLLRVIEARPKEAPSWAYNTPLLLAA